MSPGLQSQTTLLYNYSVCHQGRILCLRYNQGGGSKKTMNNHTIVGLHNLIPISNFYQFVSRNAFMNTGMKMINLHYNILQIERFLKRQREKKLENTNLSEFFRNCHSGLVSRYPSDIGKCCIQNL